MELENNPSIDEADDRNSNLEEFENEKMKEKCELIYEINTICGKENVMTYKEFEQNYINHPNELYEQTDDDSKSNSKTLDKDNKIKQDLNTNFISEQIKEEIAHEEEKPNVIGKESVLCVESNINESTEYLLGKKERISRRNSKRKKEFDECCPICGVTLRLQDLESHYIQEVEKLAKIPRITKKSSVLEIYKNNTYFEVKQNRESRLTARVAQYAERAKNEVKCPVCCLRISGTPDETNRHVALCFQDEDSDAVIDVEDDGNDSFEEYEIGDETRIRPISLVSGGHRTLLGNNSSARPTAEDEVLNVDVDGDTFNYGEPQYSELDVIPDNICEKDKTDLEKLRKAVLTDESIQPNVLEVRKWSKTDSSEESPELFKESTDLNHIVSSLREKIKDIEDQNKSVKCLICLESYTRPVVSTTCWHVHCEECWLMTMGVKKLCPQCNMIVFPSDLRKIYL